MTQIVSSACVASQGLDMGPFEDTSGNLWVLRQKTDDFTAFKSTNGGASWDGGTDSGLSNPGQGSWKGSFYDAATNAIYVAYAAGGIGFPINIGKLDCSAGTWSRFDTGTGPTYNDLSEGTLGCLTIAKRGSGEWMVYFQSPKERIMGADYRRTAYSVWNNGPQLWSATFAVSPTGTQQSYEVYRGFMGASDRFTFFFSGVSGEVFHRSLSSADSMDTAAGTGIFNSGTSYYIPGGAGVVWQLANGTFTPKRFTSQANPSFTSDSNAINSQSGATTSAMAKGENGHLYCAYVNQTDGDIYLARADNAGTTWSDQGSFLAAANANTVSARDCPQNNFVGVVYVETGGSLEFVTVATAAAAPNVLPGRPLPLVSRTARVGV